MAAVDPVTAYADRVVSGDEPAGELLRLGCERHLADRDAAAAGGEFVFRPELAERSFRLYGRFRHYKGEWSGQPIKLEPFQQFKVGCLMGWVSRETGLRRFRQAYQEEPRGQGKSTTAACVALDLAFFDGEPGAEVYCCATKREQARITWETARQIVIRSGLSGRITPMVGNLYEANHASKLQPLGADADSLDGLRPNGVIIDELHAHKNSAMVDVMTTATGTRRQPLIFEITTAGVGQIGVCWDHHEYSSKVLRGVVDDPSWFASIIAADPGDDWRSPDVWRKANPNLGVSVKLDDIARKAKQAEHIAAFQTEFQRLHLCQWVQQAEKFIRLADWDLPANVAPIDRASLRRMPCVLGLDLSSKNDITAVVAVFARPDGGVVVLPFFFAPESVVADSRRSLVPLDAWRRAGLLTVTPGNVIDQSHIKAHIVALSKEFSVREVAFDAWNATQIAVELAQDAGLEVVEVRQGFRTLSEPTKELAAFAASGQLQHGGNPVLRWMADNLVVRRDANGNVAPDKAQAKEKIDGIVALIMGLSRRGVLRARKSRSSGIVVI